MSLPHLLTELSSGRAIDFTSVGTVVICAVIAFFLIKARKTLGKLLLVVVGCLCIWGVMTHWPDMVHLYTTYRTALVASHTTTVAHTMPVAHPKHVVVQPAPTSHPLVVATAPALPKMVSYAHSVDMPATIGTFLLQVFGALLALGIIGFFLLQPHMPSLRGRGSSCMQCGQNGPLTQSSYWNGWRKVTGRVCADCAGSQEAATTPMKF